MMLELRKQVNEIAKERNIDKKHIKEAIEKSFNVILQDRNEHSGSFEVTYDDKTGDITAYQYKKVVSPEDFKNPINTISVDDLPDDTEAEVGDELGFLIENVTALSRAEVKKLYQVLLSLINRDAKEALREKYNCKKGQVLSGVVKIANSNGYLISFGEVDGFLRKEETLPNDDLYKGASIKCFIKDVNISSKGPDITLSRTNPEFVLEILKRYVPEIEEGLLEVLSIAREPGKKTKVLIKSHDESINPVHTCLGQNGNRIHQIMNEIGGENINIISGNQSREKIVHDTMAPAEIESAHFDDKNNQINVVIDDEIPNRIGSAIGSKRFNLRLAATLLGKKVNIVAKSKLKKFLEESKIELKSVEGVSDVISNLLVQSDIMSLDDLVVADKDLFKDIKNFEEIQDNAKKIVKSKVNGIEKTNFIEAFSLPMKLRLINTTSVEKTKSKTDLDQARSKVREQLGL